MNLFIKNSVAVLLMQGLNYVIPLISLPYLTRVLGVYDYGILSTILTVGSYLVLCIDFGFNLSATRKISANKNNKKIIEEIYWNVILAKLIILIAVTIVMFVLIFFIGLFREVSIYFLYIIPQLVGAVIFPLWLFQGVERLYLISFFSVFSKLLALPLLFIFVTAADKLHFAIIILSLPSLVSGIISLFFIRDIGINILKPVFNFQFIKKLVLESSPLFFGTVAISFYTACTPLILSFVSTFTEVGYYSAADKLRMAIIGIFLILGQVIYPRANYLMAYNKIKYYAFMRRLITWQISVCLFASVIFYFIMPLLAPLILGAEFNNLHLIMRIMAPMIILIPLSVILSNCLLLPMNDNFTFAMAPFITAALHCTYAIFLSKLYGALGASVAVLITEVISLMILVFVCYKRKYLHMIFGNSDG
ncbi:MULTISPECIES: oligosaccharide flippase family protein [unclassified Citrobacter]|uniref:oligosaccharide flippase family protein n=1 Tax=Citrobacter TaxID=544 RepID=UPI0015E53AB1|nr:MULTISPECIES: oligosaccharide flippase family protein [Citrobacter]MDG5474427.1 oligosaccharide flippase family protein [Citrobacter freundii]MDK5875315.1 oligosaccharide flippase family protein [Citrobacter freundii]MEB2755143.1 oligosaccharide flippase family protein [Citrobacter freundii]QLO84065.1 oligosaccharide flippase family protein [Citrobacter sp. RHBSTW-00944]QLX40453.1 oligosaccharide flippase family protein [Citrobacter sp. RHBSTW-00229]